jgi:hypothetical protein
LQKNKKSKFIAGECTDLNANSIREGLGCSISHRGKGREGVGGLTCLVLGGGEAPDEDDQGREWPLARPCRRRLAAKAGDRETESGVWSGRRRE